MTDKQQAFTRLANKRVNVAIKALQLVGNLGNRTNYEYDAKQSAKILAALQSEVDRLKEKFTTKGVDAAGGFSL